jgi:UDP-glucose 4-epimerase
VNILVTGGAGYIGSVTSHILLEAGHSVVVFDNLCHGYRAAVPRGATFVLGDLHDRAALDAAFGQHKPDAVMHFAAFIEAGESMREPGRFFHNNVAGSLNLIEATVAHGVRRFVFSSTAAVFAASDEPLKETSRIEPANCYGETKLMIERMLKWYRI